MCLHRHFSSQIALFKQPLQVSRSVQGSHTIFEYKTGKEYNDVEWFKDDVQITVYTVKLKSEEGCIYEFTINPTNVEDS